MELHTARQIIDTLSQGVHPVTGEAMPADSPYNDPSVIRALFTVSQALEVKAPRTRRDIPPNAGKPWDAQDDARLESAHREGADLKQMAEQLGRTPFGVETRLVKLGHLPPRPGMRLGVAA
ncbi:MAG: hypothetical protein Q8R01_07540 [Ramlibacter sp.]|nr:hypothetical protein [Ramlibacter sp.]